MPLCTVTSLPKFSAFSIIIGSVTNETGCPIYCMDIWYYNIRGPVVCMCDHFHRNLAIGEDHKCFIELNTKSVSPEQMKAVEDACNRKIQEQTPVKIRWLETGDPELQEVC